jgi:hypothetical protein
MAPPAPFGVISERVEREQKNRPAGPLKTLTNRPPAQPRYSQPQPAARPSLEPRPGAMGRPSAVMDRARRRPKACRTAPACCCSSWRPLLKPRLHHRMGKLCPAQPTLKNR